jgi:methenyltetrahydromethanopterin cyclohydrolase
MSLNEAAFRLAEPLITAPQAFGSARHGIGGTTVIDCGANEPGGTAAGLLLARVALAGLAAVDLRAAAEGAGATDDWPDCPWPMVTVTSDAPVAACLAAQYAGWKVATNDYFAMASGPLRAAIGRERLYDTIGHRERPSVAVGLLEASRLPPEDVCLDLAARAGVVPAGLVLLVARTASLAGTLQVVARSLETALHKLHDLGFDVQRVRRGAGRAPLPPLPSRAGDDLTSIGRTNDAILYGGQVRLEIDAEDSELGALGPRVVSSGSPSHGRPFIELFEEAGRDFYALDTALFAPATVELVSTATGRAWRFGELRPDIVGLSFSGPGPRRQPARM